MHNLVNYTQELVKAFTKLSAIAPVEATSTSTRAYTEGQYLIYNQILHKVIDDIAIGDTLATSGAGANIEATTISEEFGTGSSGHEILDASGTPVAQESSMQFKTAKVTDESGVTVVRNVVSLTQAQYDLLNPPIPGVIYEITDANASQLQSSDVGYQNTTVAAELDSLEVDKAEQAELGAVENGNLAVAHHDVGEYITRNGKFYRVKLEIQVDDPFTVGTNIEEKTVGGVVSQLNQSLTDAPFKAIALGDSDDLNTKYRGVYNTTAYTSNIPGAFPFLVFSYGGNFNYVQIACRVSDGVTYLRSCYAGTWKAWKQITLT